MPSINRRHFIAGASAAGAVLATQSWSALASLAQTATRTFSGTVTIPEGFTVPAGEVWEFDPGVSTTVVVEKNVVVYGTLRMRPSSASVVHTLRFENVDESKFVGGGMEVLETDVGLWVMGFGRLDLQGTPKTAWNRTGWDPSWLPTDEVRIAPIAKGDFGSGGFDLYKSGDPVPSIEIPGIRTWSFTDISSSPFADDIEAIYAAGITTGYPDGRFGPNDGVTRAQMAAFLVRALDIASAGSAGFSDIAGHWAEDAINRLAAAGITTGYPGGRFGPNDGVTRAQMAAFLVRALDLGSASSAGFSDIAGHWAEDSINRLAAAEITSGYGDGRFGPNDSVTRGQMAAFLMRALALSVPEASETEGYFLGTEVLNLTRNVRIQGTESGRTHVMIRSAVPQQIEYVELRHVGPRESADGFSEGILGRYGLHFHHCGEGSRGTHVRGVVVTQAGNHAFVPHMSYGVTLSDCIAYDVYEDAFWWDVKDRTDDAVWTRCVAALVRDDPSFRGFRLTGFTLGHGDRLAVIDCVAVGVLGNKNAAGFGWPEFTGGVKIEGIWDFNGCVAHNNRVNGIFVWQNTGEPNHIVSDSVFYRNGQSAIEHGAYGNRYKYRRLALIENGLDAGANGAQIIQHAQNDDLVFSDIVTRGGNVSVLTAAHRNPTGRTQYLGNDFGEYVKVLINEAEGSTGFEPGRYDFVECGVAPENVKMAFAVEGMELRSQDGDGAWLMTADGAVSEIELFA